MNKREKIIEILSRAYQKYDGEYTINAFRTSHKYRNFYFDEIKGVDVKDLDKVIEMYEQKSSGNWQMNDRLTLLECLYNVIKDNPKYYLICDKLIDIYKIELDNSLMYNTQRYDDFSLTETDKIEKQSYATKIDKSMILIDMCLKSIERTQSYSKNNVESLQQIKKSVSIYESVKNDFDKVNQPISLQIDNYVNSIKGNISSLEEENRIIEETERQKREIELINLQQEINKMENEQLEIKKRITEIGMQTMGHIFSKHMSEKYPEEFAEIQKFSEQLSDISSKSSQRIIDLRKRFDKVSSDLELYRSALPVYENYYQRYNQYHEEKQAKKNNNEQLHNYITTNNNYEVIDNNQMDADSKSKYVSEIINSLDPIEREFVPKDIENRLNSMSLSELQKLSISKSERDEKLIPPAQRNRLIGTALIKTDGYENFSSSEKQQMINQFQSYTNEQILSYIASQELKKNNSVKDEAAKEMENINNKQNVINSTNSVQNHSIDIETIVRQINEINPDITSIRANGTFEYNGQYRVNVVGFGGRNTSVEISKDLYDQLNEYFKNNPQEISTHITKKKNSDGNNINVAEQSENLQEKNQIIKDIIKSMLDAGEFSNSGLDINTKTQDIQYIKNRLEGMSVDYLRTILSEYSKNTKNSMENQEEYIGKQR